MKDYYRNVTVQENLQVFFLFRLLFQPHNPQSTVFRVVGLGCSSQASIICIIFCKSNKVISAFLRESARCTSHFRQMKIKYISLRCACKWEEIRPNGRLHKYSDGAFQGLRCYNSVPTASRDLSRRGPMPDVDLVQIRETVARCNALLDTPIVRQQIERTKVLKRPLPKERSLAFPRPGWTDATTDLRIMAYEIGHLFQKKILSRRKVPPPLRWAKVCPWTRVSQQSGRRRWCPSRSPRWALFCGRPVSPPTTQGSGFILCVVPQRGELDIFNMFFCNQFDFFYS